MSVVRLQSDRVDIRRQWQSNGRQCTREIMHDERAVRSNHELSITENIPESIFDSMGKILIGCRSFCSSSNEIETGAG